MRRSLFVGINSVFLLSIYFFLIGCNAVKKNSLEGTWERVEARFTTAGKTETPTNKAIKMFTKHHWIIVEQHSNPQKLTGESTDLDLLNAAKEFEAIGGTYTLNGEILTESVEYAFPPNWIGLSIPFNVKLEEDKWIQTGKFPNKALGFGENDTESYEVWKRID